MGSEPVTLSDMDIQWHPAFCAAAELEFLANREDLEFHREYNLGRKPLQIDLLVVEKPDEVIVENEIGRMFRKHNVIEYKSPGDGLTIDDFFKTFGYAELYKGQGKTVDEIPINQLTVSVVREGRPKGLFRSLERYGFAVERKFDGIYYVRGLHLPAQVVVTRELDRKKHRSFRVLSRKALEEDARGFVEDARKLASPGDRTNADAVLQASMSANYDLYRELKRRCPKMCEAMKILMRDEIMEAQKEAWREGEKRGERRGERRGEMKARRETARELHDMGFPMDKIAKAVKVNLETVKSWFSEQPSVAR